jgi:beta-galactosidase GanA
MTKWVRSHGRCRIAAAVIATGLSLLPSQGWAEPPTLQPRGTARQLVVDGKPFLIIGGELGNSSASSEAYMAPHWRKLRAMHLNTVLAPIAWEQMEPAEGKFDWTLLDSMLKAAKENDLKLVLLWFGAWKNSMSTYVPAWVKRDQQRFPRAALPDGRSVEILSAFAPETLKADQKAFSALLAHLKSVDSKNNTVLMVQIENEIGMLPVARDYGPLAQTAFARPVPKDLVDYLVVHKATLVPEMRRMWLDRGAKTSGSWADLFGEGDAAAEVFTAWYYAKFADDLASAGKRSYNLPLYLNVALNRPGRAPGEYPSGGPLPHLLDVWKAATPHVDLIAPDIYFTNFAQILERYHRPDNPLFVPEANGAGNATVPANALFAISAHDAIGFSPFSIDSIDDKPGALAQAYDLLEQLQPFILAAQGSDRIAGFKPRQSYDGSLDFAPDTRVMGNYRFTIAYADIQRPEANADTASYGGLMIQTGPEDYLIAGQGITVTFEPVKGGAAGIDSAFEGRFENGNWVPGRLLNGDQTHQGRHIRLDPGKWQIQKVCLYSYR